MPKKYKAESWDNLQPVDTVLANTVYRPQASSDIEFDCTSEVSHHLKTSDEQLTLQNFVEINSIIYLDASNELVLTESTNSKGSLHAAAENVLNLTAGLSGRIVYGVTGSRIFLSDYLQLRSRPRSAEASSSLVGGWEDLSMEEVLSVDPWDSDAVVALFDDKGLRQNVSLQKVQNLSARTYLSLSQSALQGPSATASNHIHLSQSTRLVEFEQAISYLRFIHSAVCHNTYFGLSEILLTHLAALDGVFPLAPSNTLVLRSVVSYIDIDFCNYAPGIGAGQFDYTPPSNIAPTLVRRTTTVLTWPYLTPLLTVELRNPTFDNAEQFSFRRINRRTRGGTLDLYRDENWPKVKRLIMSFTHLSETQRHKLFTFLQRSLGTEVGLLDFESRQWRGLLLTPSSAISQPKRNGHSFSLEFEGELV